MGKGRSVICQTSEDILSAFVSGPQQYISVRELDTKNSELVARGYTREGAHMHTMAWNFLSTALKTKSHKYTSQVYLAGGNVGRPLRVVRPSNCGGQVRPISATQYL